MTRSCFFPLRTNAGFYRIRGQLALRERLKEAALLYDEITLEDGLYEATVGANTSVEMFAAATDENVEIARKLKSSGGRFALYVGGTVAADEAAERRFVAEYRSLIREIVEESGVGRRPDWLKLVAYEAAPAMKRRVEQLAREDAQRPGFWRRKGGRRLRDRALGNLNHDLLLSAALGMPISPDGYYAPLARRKPEVSPMRSGGLVLRVTVPNYASLGWDEIMELREDPGIEDFRRTLAEIEEQELFKHADKGGDMRDAVHRRVEYELAKECRPRSIADRAGNLAVDMVVGQIPGVGLVFPAVREAAEAIIDRRRWSALFLRLKEATGD